ncbi:hypothetical protein Pla175_04750 [Pirellulimonas nuda]|uniref:Alginate export domain-containing protein n=1 Tax=Pirellulimonas nuda TaxID=2528009 RepID=A0A518D6P7_9BACT|nr:hypothetical protein [Pirellulimonas nuda]QDU87119.1 hypothetical protein Pla175_04750 [Pirellulimonas nuda]
MTNRGPQLGLLIATMLVACSGARAGEPLFAAPEQSIVGIDEGGWGRRRQPEPPAAPRYSPTDVFAEAAGGSTSLRPQAPVADKSSLFGAPAAPVRLPPPCGVPCPGDFSADPNYDYAPYCPRQEQGIYGDKYLIPTQRPLVELGLPFYDNGPIPVSQDFLGPTNLVQQKFYVYGDYRLGFSQNDLVVGENSVLAHRLNLEVDYWLTATERFHAFLGPLQEGNNFMRIEDGEFKNELDFFDAGTDTLFFEGDLGQIYGGATGQYAPIDLPVTAGLVPLLFQNGVWMLDAMTGVAACLPANNSAALDWSNFDVTFFAAFDRISTAADGFNENDVNLFGAHTFIESRGGYFEAGYAYVLDKVQAGRSYNNIGLSYTRRYFGRVSNSLRTIFNAGQDGPVDERTADGVLLLMENSLITENQYNVIPYLNFFAGFGRPQPAARAGAFGGVLFNTGILFQSDALTGYPTLDPTGNNSFGAALGADLLSRSFNQQLIVEVAALQVFDSDQGRVAPGDQYGVGARWQKALTNASLVRADVMHGWLENSGDISGARIEYRWKF